MNRAPWLATLAVVAIAVAGAVEVRADKPKTYQAQVSYTFVNNEAGPAYGLQVTFEGTADVQTAEDSGRAGPFRNVKGNGTGTIELTNPDGPIEPGSESFELVFRSYGKKLAIASWWWTDDKGKRLGDKHKG